MNPDAYLEMADTESRHWWFTGRRRILASVIGSLNLPDNARVLEIGSGTGGNLKMLSRFGKVSSVEMDETARAIASDKTGGVFDIRDGICPTDMPFKPGEKFDLICLFDVLEHIEDDVAALACLKKLLADGGRVLVTVPAYQWLWSAHDQFLHHKRRYSSKKLKAILDKTGFRADKVSHFNTFLFPLAAGARLLDRLLGRESASGTSVPGSFVNSTLQAIFSFERFFLGWMSFPFGVSIIAHFHPE